MAFRSPIRTVGIAGTVTTTGSSGGTSTASTGRRADSTSLKTTSPMTVTTPSDCAANDLLIVAVSRYDGGGNGSFNPAESGWTRVPSGSSGGKYSDIFYRVATSADAAGAKTYSFNITPATAQSGVAPVLVMTAIGGYTTPGTSNAVTTPNSSGTAYTNELAFPSVASPGMAVIVVAGTPNIDAPTWQATPSGPPGSPQPVWTGKFYKGADESLQCGIFTSPITWTPAASYKAQEISRDQSISIVWFPVK